MDDAKVQPQPAPDAAQLLDVLVGGRRELRPLPAIATQIIRMAEDDRFSAQELGRTVSMDQALTLTVLRIANSAFYGLPRRITTLRESVVLLGFREVKALAVAACLMAGGGVPAVLGCQRFGLNSGPVRLLARSPGGGHGGTYGNG